MLNPAQTHQALCFASAETAEQTHNFSEPENNPLLLLSLHKQLSKQLRWDIKWPSKHEYKLLQYLLSCHTVADAHGL